MEQTVIRLRINGKVQGVGFRAWVLAQARQLGLSGWVCNCGDGTVEALFAGPQGQVEQMLTLCGHGPDSAQVEDLEVTEAGDGAAPPDFRILDEREMPKGEAHGNR